jgi:hypothetical protein
MSSNVETHPPPLHRLLSHTYPTSDFHFKDPGFGVPFSHVRQHLLEGHFGVAYEASGRLAELEDVILMHPVRLVADNEVYQPSGHRNFLYDILACQQLLHHPIGFHQRQQRLSRHVGVGNDLVADATI